MKIKILSILFFLFFLNSKAQWEVSPPRREPDKEQIEAVEKFIKITDYKKSIESFLYYSIYKHRYDYNDDVLTEVYDSFDFESFKKNSNIYHLLDGFSIKEIDEIEQLYIKNKNLKGNYPTFITPEIVDQINIFVEGQLEPHQKGRTEKGIKRRTKEPL